jgi:hypothetical protein
LIPEYAYPSNENLYEGLKFIENRMKKLIKIIKLLRFLLKFQFLRIWKQVFLREGGSEESESGKSHNVGGGKQKIHLNTIIKIHKDFIKKHQKS